MTRTITLIPGDGIGPEISECVTDIIDAAGLKIDWDIQNAGEDVAEKEGTPLPDRVINSIKKNKIALKAPITTPIGKGFRSVNVTLRKELNLYANVRPCSNLTGIKTRFDNRFVELETGSQFQFGERIKLDPNFDFGFETLSTLIIL